MFSGVSGMGAGAGLGGRPLGFFSIVVTVYGSLPPLGERREQVGTFWNSLSTNILDSGLAFCNPSWHTTSPRFDFCQRALIGFGRSAMSNAPT